MIQGFCGYAYVASAQSQTTCDIRNYSPRLRGRVMRLARRSVGGERAKSETGAAHVMDVLDMVGSTGCGACVGMGKMVEKVGGGDSHAGQGRVSTEKGRRRRHHSLRKGLRAASGASCQEGGGLAIEMRLVHHLSGILQIGSVTKAWARDPTPPPAARKNVRNSLPLFWTTNSLGISLTATWLRAII